MKKIYKKRIYKPQTQIILIESCYECGRFCANGHNCNIISSKIKKGRLVPGTGEFRSLDIVNEGEIPEWCPLETVTNQGDLFDG